MNKLLLGLTIGLLLMAPAALAGHEGAPITVHRTYETALHNQGAVAYANSCAPGSDDLGTSCDPTGQTQDGSIDIGGIVFVPDGDTLEPGVDSVQGAIVDDVNGAGVQAGSICTDENANNICGEEDEGEADTDFCGSSDVLEIPPAPNFDAVAVFVWGTTAQAYWGCDVVSAPAATSGGVLNPAAGIFLTFG